MAWKLELLKRLVDHDISFVIIGGVAAITHGASRITEDLDICAPLDAGKPRRIIEALDGLHARWLPRPDLGVISTNDQILNQPLKNMYLITDAGKLDILGELPGIGTFNQIQTRVIEVQAFGMKCKVIDIETLIAAKEFAGRQKDRPTIIELKLIRDALDRQKNTNQKP